MTISYEEQLRRMGIRMVRGPGGGLVLGLPESSQLIAVSGIVNPATGETQSPIERLQAAMPEWQGEYAAKPTAATAGRLARETFASSPTMISGGTHGYTETTRESNALWARRAGAMEVQTGTGDERMNIHQIGAAPSLQDYYFRPGGDQDELLAGGEVVGQEYAVRAYPMSSLEHIPGVVRQGDDIYFGSASAGNAVKDIQFAARVRPSALTVGMPGGEWGILPPQVSSIVAGPESAQPEIGHRLNTMLTFGSAAPAGQAGIRRDIQPADMLREHVRIRPQDVQFFQEGALGQTVRSGESLTAFSLGGYQHQITPPKNWANVTLTGARVTGAETDNPAVELTMVGRGGGIGLKGGYGGKGYAAPIDIDRRFASSIPPTDVVIEGVKNWRMLAASALGAMDTGTLGGYLSTAYGQLQAEGRGGVMPSLVDREGIGGEATQAYRWDLQSDPVYQRAFMNYAREPGRIQVRQEQFAVGAKNIMPWMMGKMIGEGGELGRALGASPFAKFAIPGVTGLERNQSSVFGLPSFTGTRNVLTMSMPLLHQVRREYEYGRTRMSMEEASQTGQVTPELLASLESEGLGAGSPYVQAMRLGRFYSQDIESPGPTRAGEGISWLGAQATAGARFQEGMTAEQRAAAAIAGAPPAATLAEGAAAWGAKYGEDNRDLMKYTVGGEDLYMMSPGQTQQLMVGDPQMGSRLGHAYMGLAESLARYEELGEPASKDVFGYYAKYQEAVGEFSSLKGVQKKASDVLLGRQGASEGTYFGSWALNPGEIFMGRQRWEQMFPQMREDAVWGQFQKQLSSKGLFGLGWRRPTSDWGQIAGRTGILSESEYVSRGGEIDPNSSALVVSQAAATLNRGDFDADRFINILGASLNFNAKTGAVTWKNPKELRDALGGDDTDMAGWQTGLAGRTMNRLLAGFSAITPRGPLMEDEEGNPIEGGLRGAIQNFRARNFYAPVMKRMHEEAGLTEKESLQWMTSMIGGPAGSSNEMRDVFEKLAKAPVEPGQLIEAIEARFGMSMTSDEFRQATVNDVFSKELMGATYNFFQRDLGARMSESGRRSLVEPYQKALDRSLGTTDRATRQLLSAYYTYSTVPRYNEQGQKVASAGGMYGKFLLPEELAGQEKGMQRPLSEIISTLVPQMQGIPDPTKAEMLVGQDSALRRVVQGAIRSGEDVFSALTKHFGGDSKQAIDALMAGPLHTTLRESGGSRASNRYGEAYTPTEAEQQLNAPGENRAAMRGVVKPEGGPVAAFARKIQQGMAAYEDTPLGRTANFLLEKLGGPGAGNADILSTQQSADRMRALAHSVPQLSGTGNERLEAVGRVLQGGGGVRGVFNTITGSELGNLQTEEAAFSMLSRGVRNLGFQDVEGLKDLGGLFPEDIVPFSYGTEIHEGIQRAFGLDPQKEEKVYDPKWGEKVGQPGYGFSGQLDFPSARTVGNRIVDIKPIPGISKAKTAEEYERMVNEYFARDDQSRYRYQMKGYSMAKGGASVGIHGYDPDLQKEGMSKEQVIAQSIRQAREFGFIEGDDNETALVRGATLNDLASDEEMRARAADVVAARNTGEGTKNSLKAKIQRLLANYASGVFGGEAIAPEGSNVDEVRTAVMRELNAPSDRELAVMELRDKQGMPQSDIDAIMRTEGAQGLIARAKIPTGTREFTGHTRGKEAQSITAGQMAVPAGLSNEVLEFAKSTGATIGLSDGTTISWGTGAGGGGNAPIYGGFSGGGGRSGIVGPPPGSSYNRIGPQGEKDPENPEKSYVPDEVVKGLIALRNELDPDDGNKIIGKLRGATKIVQDFNDKVQAFERGDKGAEKPTVREQQVAQAAARVVGETLPYARSTAAEVGGIERRWYEGLSAKAQLEPETAAGRAGMWLLGKDSPRWSLENDIRAGQRSVQEMRGLSGGGFFGDDGGGFFNKLMNEFSFGGAAIKIGIAQRYTTNVARQWAAEGAAPAEARLRLARALGASDEDVMGGGIGDVLGYQAQLADYRAARGEAALQVEGGANALFSPAGNQAMARTMGGIGSIALRSAGNALTMGIIASSAGKLIAGSATEGSWLAGAGSTLQGSAGTIAGIAGIATAAYYGLGGIYGAGTEENQRKQWREFAQDRNPLGMNAIVGVGRWMRNVKEDFWNPQSWSMQEAKWGGMEEYLGSEQRITDEAIDKLLGREDLGLTDEQASQLGMLLTVTGIGSRDILGGRGEDRIQKLAPMAKLGVSDEYIQGLMQAGGSVGVSPGAGLGKLMDTLNLAGPDQPELFRQQQDALSILGSAYRSVGRPVDYSQFGAITGRLASGEEQWMVQQDVYAQAGNAPFAASFGWSQGSVGAQSLAELGTQAQQSAMNATYGRMQRGIRLQSERTGRSVEGLTAVIQAKLDSGETTIEQEERLLAATQGTGFEQAGLAPFGKRAMELSAYLAPKRVDDERGWELYGETQAFINEASGMLGMKGDFLGAGYNYQSMRAAGYSTAEAGAATMLQQGGRSSLGEAFGGVAGWTSRGSEAQQAMINIGVGQIMIDKVESIGQYGQSAMGYSMMTGGLEGGGIGEAVRTVYGGMSRAGYSTMPQGQPLYVSAPTPSSGGTREGIYSWGQLEMDQAQQAYQFMSMQKTLGVGPYGTQSIPTWDINVPTHRSQFTQAQLAQMGIPAEQTWIDQQKTVGGGTFQLGLIGQTQDAIESYQVWQQTRGIDAQIRAAQRAQQDDQSNAARQRLDLQYRHSLESLGMSMRMWGSGVEFQRQEMGYGWEQMQVQQAWGREDMALGRQQAGYAHEFQMGEMQRSWRMASGRQKAALGRQMEYQEEMFSFAEEGRANEEERFNQREQWEEEQFERQKQHFEETTALQLEQFEMQRRHIEEKYQLELALLGKQIETIKKMRELEDKRREVTEEFEDKQRRKRIAEAMSQEAWYRDVEMPYKRWLVQMENQIRDSHAEYVQWQLDQINVLGGNWETMINQIAEMLVEAFPVLEGRLGKATWTDIDTTVEEPPHVAPPALPESIKLVVEGEEFTAWVQSTSAEGAEGAAAVEDWEVYD